jgi:hypothetical protein
VNCLRYSIGTLLFEIVNSRNHLQVWEILWHSWTRNKIVCLSSGQRSKKQNIGKDFSIYIIRFIWPAESANLVFRPPYLSTNQISSRSKVRQSDPFMVLIPPNQIFMRWEFRQLSVSMVGSRRIRFFCAGEPANQVFYGRRAAQSGFWKAVVYWTIFWEDLAINQPDSCEGRVALILQVVKLYFSIRCREENPMRQEIHPIPFGALTAICLLNYFSRIYVFFSYIVQNWYLIYFSINQITDKSKNIRDDEGLDTSFN